MALHGTVKYSDMREVLVSLSWKYVVLSVLGAVLVPFLCAWFWTYNFDVKFSCEKSKNLCQIERVNFANKKVVKNISQTDILNVQRNIDLPFLSDKQAPVAGANHSVVVRLKDGKAIKIYDINTRFSQPIEDMNEKANQINSYLQGSQNGYSFHHINRYGLSSVGLKLFFIFLLSLVGFFFLIPSVFEIVLAMNPNNLIGNFIFKTKKM